MRDLRDISDLLLEGNPSRSSALRHDARESAGLSTRASLLAGSLAICLSLASPAWSGPLEGNRKLIITDKAFTADKYILDQACIMVELYYRMDEDEGLLYDPEAPDVVFGKVPLRNLSFKAAEDSLARARDILRAGIQLLAVTPEVDWNETQQSFRRLFPSDWNPSEMSASAQRMTGRRGMRRTFIAGLESSIPYQDLMDSVFRAEGIPLRLKFLAHVESRFNPEAVSPAGAAGMWQFLKSSGSRYMTIDERVDQRFDPRAATGAAAKFLKACRTSMSSWPLAIMAYNNGPARILDAVRETGSRDASEIIRNYEADGFGGVSRNYYAMFLAASSLGLQSDMLFPGLRKVPSAAPSFRTLKLEHEWTPCQLRILSGFSTAVLMKYNPALRPAVFERNLPVPKGFELKLPVGLPSSQDLQFADLGIANDGADPLQARKVGAMAGFPMPRFAENLLLKVRNTLLSNRAKDTPPVLSYMHSQGLLDADKLALARQDRILIEPHPALQAMLDGMGG
ncbi:MAG: lytic transglycosylase domain-containing protein [Fibrobacteria bacterium]